MILQTKFAPGLQTEEEKVGGKAIRPNIECTDGYIHLVDTAMLDNAPPWTILSSAAGMFDLNAPAIFVLLSVLILVQ